MTVVYPQDFIVDEARKAIYQISSLGVTCTDLATLERRKDWGTRDLERITQMIGDEGFLYVLGEKLSKLSKDTGIPDWSVSCRVHSHGDRKPFFLADEQVVILSSTGGAVSYNKSNGEEIKRKDSWCR